MLFKTVCLIPICAALSLPFATETTIAAPVAAAKEIQVFFSPKGGCTEAVIQNIAAAKTNIFVQAYSFTSAPIAKALVEAHRRSVKVTVILDKSNRTANFSMADFLADAGIRTLIDAKHAIAHNKIMIIDQQIVITGSFNFTKAAEENNAENLLAIHNRDLAAEYFTNWKNHSSHSSIYQSRLNR